LLLNTSKEISSSSLPGTDNQILKNPGIYRETSRQLAFEYRKIVQLPERRRDSGEGGGGARTISTGSLFTGLSQRPEVNMDLVRVILLLVTTLPMICKYSTLPVVDIL
jgi:hypothetical protein